ncbi:hypothetical protein CSIM01_04873 [Colletotrichum simmondsii]|uniref:Uncharacterized protein n=1 Tax=Colletotrichum simmondsii TaxID=703756 RepID=A0A135TK50_9PEZI|nr:hypothetical protein CSIM01_04873 [Colletotrichum simmondsii]
MHKSAAPSVQTPTCPDTTSLQSVKLELANIDFWANLRRGIIFPIPTYLPTLPYLAANTPQTRSHGRRHAIREHDIHPSIPKNSTSPTVDITIDITPTTKSNDAQKPSNPPRPRTRYHPTPRAHFGDGRAFPATTDLTCALPVVIELSDFTSLSLPMLPITDTR